MKSRWVIALKANGHYLSEDCAGYTPRLALACLFGSKLEVLGAIEDGGQEEAIRLDGKQLQEVGG